MATKPNKSQAEILAEWIQTSTATATHATGLAHLEDHRIHLERLSVEFRGLSAQQDQIAASRQEITKRKLELLIQGNRLATFLRAGARQHFGADSKKLVEFGLQPTGQRRRKKAGPDTPAEPTPQANPTE